jgi:hypothetical protein
VDAVLRVAEKSNLGRWMDFDPEVAVRLHWAGTKVVTVDTPVKYRPEIPSHFNLWKDNVRISWMNTRLFFGMLARSPGILARKIFR